MSNYAMGINTLSSAMMQYAQQQQQQQQQQKLMQRQQTMEDERHTASILSQYIRDSQAMQQSAIKRDMEMSQLRSQLAAELGQKAPEPLGSNPYVRESANLGYQRGTTVRNELEAQRAAAAQKYMLDMDKYNFEKEKYNQDVDLKRQQLAWEQQKFAENEANEFKLKELELADRAKDRATQRGIAETNKGVARTQETDKQVATIAKDVAKAGIPQQRARIAKLRGLLDAEGGKDPLGTGYLARGVEAFIPGGGALVNAGIGMFGNERDQEVRQLFQDIINEKLNAMGGVSISADEKERLKTALGAALGQGPEAIKRALDQIESDLDSMEQGFVEYAPPEARDAYKKRSSTLPAKEQKKRPPPPPVEALKMGEVKLGLTNLDNTRMVDASGNTHIFNGQTWVKE